MRTSFFSSAFRQSTSVAAGRQDGSPSADPKSSSTATASSSLPAGAPQPIDAELLKFVGGAGLGYSPVNRW